MTLRASGQLFGSFLLKKLIHIRIAIESSRAVVSNPGPQGTPVLHVLDVSLLQHT